MVEGQAKLWSRFKDPVIEGEIWTALPEPYLQTSPITGEGDDLQPLSDAPRVHEAA